MKRKYVLFINLINHQSLQFDCQYCSLQAIFILYYIIIIVTRECTHLLEDNGNLLVKARITESITKIPKRNSTQLSASQTKYARHNDSSLIKTRIMESLTKIPRSNPAQLSASQTKYTRHSMNHASHTCHLC